MALTVIETQLDPIGTQLEPIWNPTGTQAVQYLVKILNGEEREEGCTPLQARKGRRAASPFRPPPCRCTAMLITALIITLAICMAYTPPTYAHHGANYNPVTACWV